MTRATAAPLPHSAIQRLHVKNYRVLRDVTFKDLSPLTVFTGPNGSGKSTIFDVFAFLHEAFTDGLRPAWDRRNRMREIRSRGSDGPVVFEIRYRQAPTENLISYLLHVDEEQGRPVVLKEVLRWTQSQGAGHPTHFLDFARGSGTTFDEVSSTRSAETLTSADLLAVSTLGQLSRHPRVVALRSFITGWYLSYVSAGETRNRPQSGPAERLSARGDNLPNVLQNLQENHPDRLAAIFQALRERVPQLERLIAERMTDGRLLLQLKDAAFEDPVFADQTSDGTLKLLAYLTVLYDPSPPSIIGIEEPENQLHPRVVGRLAEEARSAAARSQVLITTHSPYLVDELRPRELWVIDRGINGFSRVTRASDVPVVQAMSASGGRLGHLWMEGYFGVGDPLRFETA